MSRFHLDYETFSEADLKKYGAWRYASDPSTEIILCAVSRDDGPVEIWDACASEKENAPATSILCDMVLEDDAIIYAHNAGFERAITHYLWWKTFGIEEPDQDKWRCTAALCRVAAIPESLEKAAEFLNLHDKKDAAGKALIKIFCVPRKSKARGIFRSLPSDPGKVTVAGKKIETAEAWEMFRGYCVTDVVVEREIEERLRKLELTGTPLAGFLSDIRMNSRGIPVHTEAIINAEALITEYQARISKKFTEITGIAPTQTAKLLEWLRARGYPENDLRAGTVAAYTGIDVSDDEDEEEPEEGVKPTVVLKPEVKEVLEMRALLSFAAIKKLPTMRLAACPDDRVRGVVQWHGAARTGRDSSKIIQVQNMRRPTVNTEIWEKNHGEPETHTIFKMIRDGTGDMDTFDAVFGPPLECVASAIRHFIGYKDGTRFLDIDLAQIEARVLAWVSGHNVLLQAFRDGKDLYKQTASLLWGTPYEKVGKEERFLGKVASLACGYQGGVDAFSKMAEIYGVKIDPEKAEAIVKAYRKGNPSIVQFWKKLQETAVLAVSDFGRWHNVNDKIAIATTDRLGFKAMQIRLPSGRILNYPLPEIVTVYKARDGDKKWITIPQWKALDAVGDKKDGVWITTELSYHGQRPQTVHWGRVKTHGGTVCENICQGIAGDFLTNGVLQAEKDGYDVLFKVHDQGIFDYRPERGNSVEGLVKAVTTVPDWAPGFPLAAEAAITDFYTK